MIAVVKILKGKTQNIHFVWGLLGSYGIYLEL